MKLRNLALAIIFVLTSVLIFNVVSAYHMGYRMMGYGYDGFGMMPRYSMMGDYGYGYGYGMMRYPAMMDYGRYGMMYDSPRYYPTRPFYSYSDNYYPSYYNPYSYSRFPQARFYFSPLS